MIKIVTDTACNLPPGVAEQYSVSTIPFNIQFGLQTFQEGVNITPQTFYRRIQAEQALPTTSQPAVGEFCRLYQTLAADGSQILSIHLTSKLSGAWQAAVLAAKQVQNQAAVHVVDSLTGSVGQGMMVREAVKLCQAGLTAAEIVSRLKARRPQIHVFIMLNDLRYARMSGRVGAIRETLVSLLNVKPIIGVDNGALVPLDRVRGYKKGMQRMLALARQAVGDAPVHLGIAQALVPAKAEALLAEAQTCLNCRDSFIADLPLSLAVHFGPGTLGFATYPAE